MTLISYSFIFLHKIIFFNKESFQRHMKYHTLHYMYVQINFFLHLIILIYSFTLQG